MYTNRGTRQVAPQAVGTRGLDETKVFFSGAFCGNAVLIPMTFPGYEKPMSPPGFHQHCQWPLFHLATAALSKSVLLVPQLYVNVGREAALLQDHTAPEAKGIESPGMSQRHPLEAPDPVACKELAGQALVEWWSYLVSLVPYWIIHQGEYFGSSRTASFWRARYLYS